MTRAARRGGLLLAPLLVVGGLGPAAVAAQDPPIVFEVVTTAVGLSVSSTQRPAASVVTGGLVDSSAGYASSALSSAGASASASAAVYPGDLVASGPTLLCSEFLPCPVTPPAYPLLAQASWPERPSASADSSTPAGNAQAAAHEFATEGRSEATHATAPGAPVTISAATQSTRTRAWADDTGAHVRASSTLHDVVVGPLHIAILTATDAVDVTTSGRVSDQPGVELSGVTFAGLTASVDDRGVHVAGVSQSLPDRALAQQGLDVRALGTTRDDVSGAARSTAGGLRVTFTVPVQGVPPVVPGLPSADRSYLGSLIVGGVGAAVGVGAPGEPLLAGLPPAAPSSLAGRLLSRQGVGATTPGGSGTRTQPVQQLPTSVTAFRPRPPALPQPDLRWLALALAVTPLSLLLGWRLAVRRRTA